MFLVILTYKNAIFTVKAVIIKKTWDMIDNSFYEKLASTVEYHRKKSGLNRVELASLAGVGKTVIYDIEHAKSTVRLSSIIKILNVLNIKIELISPLMRDE